MPFAIARIEKLFKSPGPQPNGIQASPDGLWALGGNQSGVGCVCVSYFKKDVVADIRRP